MKSVYERREKFGRNHEGRFGDVAARESTLRRTNPLGAATCVLFSLVLFLIGCSPKSEFPLAPVAGLVTFQGQPVKGGIIQFAPDAKEGLKAGKAAVGEIREDGTFSMSSFTPNDGAVIGTGRIFYIEPSMNAEPPPDAEKTKTWTPPQSGYEGLVPRESQITISRGPNKLTVELVRP